jgi:GTP cyclohydrolase I
MPTVSALETTLESATTQELYRELLTRIGEDPERDGLLGTPERMEKSMKFLTRGYTMDVTEVLHNALFDVDYDEMVIVKDIEFFSMCEHHLLPFFGKAHIAYLPKGKVIGLSKVARVVDMFARRLQVQERLTREVADAIDEAIQPQGVAVIMEAQHLCMMMRGVEKQHSPSPLPCSASSKRSCRRATSSCLWSGAPVPASEDVD